ncbi:MAG: hypothetical protein HY708_07980, partial [Ignavibacteriae bacterium]|nr:hypothetical protein [Ignavibacteriota bacterium]
MKRFATIALLIAMVGGSAFAQAKWGGIARHIAMGGTQFGAGLVLNPYIYEDPAFLLVNPAYQVMYGDYGWMNVGGGTLTGVSTGDNGYNTQNVGVSFEINNQFFLGGVFSYDPSAVNAIGGLIGTIAQRPTQAPHINPDGSTGVRNVWELVGALDLGMLDLGFSFMYGNSNFDSTNSVTGYSSEVSSRMFGGRAGALIDIGGGSSVDLSGQIRLDKATDKLLTSTAAGTAGDYS